MRKHTARQSSKPRGVVSGATAVITSLLLAACQALNPPGRSFTTPDLPNWGSTPVYGESLLPGYLRCVDVPPDPPLEGGVEWEGLRVGVSTYEQVVEALVEPDPGEVYMLWDTGYGNLTIYNNADRLTWGSVKLCFAGGRLSALNIVAPADFPERTSEIVGSYGKADYAVWSGGYRTFFWADKGFALFIDSCMGISDVVLFSPVPRCELPQSWVYRSLQGLGIPSGGGDFSCANDDVLDPSHIAIGLDDCP